MPPGWCVDRQDKIGLIVLRKSLSEQVTNLITGTDLETQGLLASQEAPMKTLSVYAIRGALPPQIMNNTVQGIWDNTLGVEVKY